MLKTKLKTKIKQLPNLAILLMAVTLIPNCASIKTATKASKKNKSQQESYPTTADATDISSLITVIRPELAALERENVANQILEASQKYKIDPRILIAIIDTESTFQQNKVSTTGDVSIAQINVKIWNQELRRMKKLPLNKARLKKDQHYAIMKMGEILTILKNRYELSDSTWFARYHSRSFKHKNDYMARLDKRLNKMSHSGYTIKNKIVLAQLN